MTCGKCEMLGAIGPCDECYHRIGPAPSPEPAAKTELTAEELGYIRAGLQGGPAPIQVSTEMALRMLRLLDEHAAQKVELDHIKEDRDFWRVSSRQDGKAKLRAEGELRQQERATKQVSETVMELMAARDAAESALVEARSIADRPLGTHIDYEPMDMIRDLQKALGARVHDREPCRCGNVKDLAEARATIERLISERKYLAQ